MSLPDKHSGLTANAEYLAHLYEQWKRDPGSVSADYAHFFQGFELGAASEGAGGAQRKQSAVNSLVFHYRALGHRQAKKNPLDENTPLSPELELQPYGLSDRDMDTVFDSNHIPGISEAPLRELINIMRDTYCGFLSVEYMHIQEKVERRWLQERMEPTRNQPHFSERQRLRILQKLSNAETLEQFLHANYRGQKRFSLEGAESLIPAMDYLIDKAGNDNVADLVIGVSHRGRLNVLANIVEKSYSDIFSEFEDNFLLDTRYGDGDVKYHKGFSNNVVTASGKPIHLSLTSNPSHLEVVGPVVEGKARAKQAALGDVERKRVIPFIVHGDAAFAGQGVVAENFNLSQLKGYRTGGTIHFIVNNQLGFTTTAQDYLSGMYATDVAKMMGLPIFHVNGDHPEHVLLAMDMAYDFRQRFAKDVVIDMWCYRRYGHSEADEPSYTQPLLYELIKKHPSVVDLYARELAESGIAPAVSIADGESPYEKMLHEARLIATQQPRTTSGGHPHLRRRWKGLKREYSYEIVETGAPEDQLLRVGEVIGQIPPDFDVHRKVRQVLEDFSERVRTRSDMPWAGAETLAFGTLLLEGTGVRLSGEDSRRGTFSQRHAVLYDQRNGDQYIPLMHLSPDQGQFCVYDSSLAEESVLGFDYGYSVADPYRLICWEAQFGDFINGAQVILDQFIVSSQSKWRRMSGMVLLLPHGYEGQGPEHSNAWLRRHLTACAEDNIQVVYPTTPAQYFHVLRRQMKRDFRRPLFVLTPKSLLRDPRMVSPFKDFTSGHFREIIDDERHIQNPRRVIFCAGKVYFDVMERLQAEGCDDIAVVRVEQFYPINTDLWHKVVAPYKNATEWVWLSEEPTNFGAWAFMEALLWTLYDGKIWYVGRARSASPATGSVSVHKRQQSKLLEHAVKKGPLEHYIDDGVAVYRRGEERWHMKSTSPTSENQSGRAP